MANIHAELIDRWLTLDRDEWTRHVVRRHFDPETGSPYWLERAAADRSFDPRDITRYDQLVELGPFPLDVLRQQDPARMVPKAVARPLQGRVWETGGTTGTPCRVFYTKQMLEHRAIWRRWMIHNSGFERDRTWLHAAPVGPHLYGQTAWELADGFASMIYTIDMDPRWVKRLVRSGRQGEVNKYVTHLLEQVTNVLTTQTVNYMVTTPALFQALVKAHPELVGKLGGVQLGGTQLTPEMYRDFEATLGGGITSYHYGNTLGNCVGLLSECDGEFMPCASTYPVVNHDVVDRTDKRTIVGYGETGRIRLTHLSEDLFLPNVLERDQAFRYDTGDRWPCDGVANVRPLYESKQAPEGLF